MATKKKVTLEVFKDAVLPMLQHKHKKIEELQAVIDTEYLIYEDKEDGTIKTIEFRVQEASSLSTETDEEFETRVNEAVEKRIAEKANGKGKAATKSLIDNNGKDDKKFSIPAECKRFGAPQNFLRKEVGGFDPEERAYRFGQWVLAANGRQKAVEFCRNHGIPLVIDTETKTAHSEGTNTAGGYLVPEEFGADMIDLRERYGVVRRLFKMKPMTSDTKTDPRRTSGLTAYFVAEGGAGTESNKGWDQVLLTAKDLMVLSRMSNQLNEDAVISIGDDLAGEISYAFTLKEDQCGFLGDATSTYGGIVGVSTKLGNINGVDDGGGLVLASGNLFSEFVLGDFNKTVGAIPQFADTPNACWVAHRSFYYGTMQRLETAAGGVTSSEVREGSRKPRPLFLGYPVEFSQVMPSADANSQIACLFGDFSLAARFGDRRQDTIAFSDSATVGGESVFERNQIAIRGTERFDINVHDVGTATAAGPVVGLISAAS